MLLAKLALPSLFFHQIILQRNIWRQLTNGLFLPVAVEMLISPQRPGQLANATCHRGACHPVPLGDMGGSEDGDPLASYPVKKTGIWEEEKHLPRLSFDFVPP